MRLAPSIAALALAAVPAAPARAQTVPVDAIAVVEVRDLSGDVVREVAGPDADEVLLVQIALARAGWDPGVRSGTLDLATRRALSRFQSDRGLRACGCVSYETVVALGIRPVVVAARAARGARDRTVVVYLPATRDPWYAGSGVVVGHDPYGRTRSGVYVGHAPARGAGERYARPPRRDPGHVGSGSRGGARPPRPEPVRSRSGSRIRAGAPPRP